MDGDDLNTIRRKITERLKSTALRQMRAHYMGPMDGRTDTTSHRDAQSHLIIASKNWTWNFLALQLPQILLKL